MKIAKALRWPLGCLAFSVCAWALVSVRANEPGQPLRNASRPQEDLRWNLKKGQKFKVEFRQNSKQTIEMNGNTQEMPTESAMQMTWLVDDVNDNEISMTQTIDRITLRSTLPNRGDIDYDSARNEELDGIAGQFAQTFDLVVGQKLKQTIDRRGNSIKFEMDPAVVKQLQNVQLPTPLSNPDTLKQLIAQLSCIFSDKPVSSGDSWEHKLELNNTLGKMVTASKYTYAGSEVVNGTSLEKISVAQTLNIEPKESSPVEIKIESQDNNGVVYFNKAEGRVSHASINQNMTMLFESLGNEAKMSSVGKLEFTIVPDDGASSGSEQK
jgi:hypothetical protein